MQDLELHHNLLDRTAKAERGVERPTNQKIGPAPAKRILSLDAPSPRFTGPVLWTGPYARPADRAIRHGSGPAIYDTL